MENLTNINIIDTEFFNDTLEMVAMLESGSEDAGKVERVARKSIYRDFAKFDKILHNDYFSETPRYPANVFKRRFRMPKGMFLKISDDLANLDPFFKLRYDAAKRRGLSTFQKCTAALRLLAYGNSADSVDEYIKVGESTLLEILRKFCKGIISLYENRYLRSPDEHDVKKLMDENAKRGFPGMLGSIDCMHWYWKNCPVAHAGQYQGKEGKPSVVLEAIASYNLHIWHCFFGLPGSLNDINILDRSPLIDNVIEVNLHFLFLIIQSLKTSFFRNVFQNVATRYKETRDKLVIGWQMESIQIGQFLSKPFPIHQTKKTVCLLRIKSRCERT